ncbi:MAG: penicillin-binding transpeptidase domain-containing protein [Candidatus Marinimicrobia bacterium]|nr:penicillin-binding transpeptidase domain-containing protein [Candidatus Neomarinimicrobiota bacterium]
MRRYQTAGPWLKPYIVSTAFNEKGKVIRKSDVYPVRRVISGNTSETLRYILEKVVEEGTGTRARIEKYHVAGKTGTAQTVVDGKYSNSKYYASFIGFFPANDPVMVCGIVIDEPAYGLHHGGTAAAPAVKEVFTRIINTRDFNTIYRSLPKPDTEPVAEKDAGASGLLLSMLHRSQRAPDFPEESTEIPDEDTTDFPEELYDIIMPDVVGMHILELPRQNLKAIGLSVERNASRGKVGYQYPHREPI